jgi:hypothetical protein
MIPIVYCKIFMPKEQAQKSPQRVQSAIAINMGEQVKLLSQAIHDINSVPPKFQSIWSTATLVMNLSLFSIDK